MTCLAGRLHDRCRVSSPICKPHPGFCFFGVHGFLCLLLSLHIWTLDCAVGPTTVCEDYQGYLGMPECENLVSAEYAVLRTGYRRPSCCYISFSPGYARVCVLGSSGVMPYGSGCLWRPMIR